MGVPIDSGLSVGSEFRDVYIASARQPNDSGCTELVSIAVDSLVIYVHGVIGNNGHSDHTTKPNR